MKEEEEEKEEENNTTVNLVSGGTGSSFPRCYIKIKHIIRKLLASESHFCNFQFQQRSAS